MTLRNHSWGNDCSCRVNGMGGLGRMIQVGQKGCHSGLPRWFTAQGPAKGVSEQGMKPSLPSTHQLLYLGMGCAHLEKAVSFSTFGEDAMHLARYALGKQ